MEVSCCNRVDKIHDLSSVLGWKHLKNIVFVVIGTCKEERASMLEGNLFLIYGSMDDIAGPLLKASANSFLIPSRYFTLRSRSVNFWPIPSSLVSLLACGCGLENFSYQLIDVVLSPSHNTLGCHFPFVGSRKKASAEA